MLKRISTGIEPLKFRLLLTRCVSLLKGAPRPKPTQDKMEVVLEFCSKVAMGTALFIFIQWLAQGSRPTATGMMLTFPALNGIGLAFSGRPDLHLMARAMIPMIAFNGILCAMYLIAHRKMIPCATTISCWRKIEWFLFGSGVLAWATFACALAPFFEQWPISAIIMFFVSLVIILSFFLRRSLRGHTQDPYKLSRKTLPAFLGEALLKKGPTRKKTTCMAVLIFAVLFTAWLGKDVGAGRLSAFPLLPLYTLVMIPYDQSDPQKRILSLDRLGLTVLFGPMVAMTFVTGFVHVLDSLKKQTGIPGLSFLLLLVLWTVCGVAIWMVSTFVDAKVNKTKGASPNV